MQDKASYRNVVKLKKLTYSSKGKIKDGVGLTSAG